MPLSSCCIACQWKRQLQSRKWMLNELANRRHILAKYWTSWCIVLCQTLLLDAKKAGACIVFFVCCLIKFSNQNFVNHRHAIELLNLSSLNFDACQWCRTHGVLYYYDVLGMSLSYLLLSWNMQDCNWCEDEEGISGVYRVEQMSWTRSTRPQKVFEVQWFFCAILTAPPVANFFLSDFKMSLVWCNAKGN